MDLIKNTLLEGKESICEKLMPREEKIFFSLRFLSEMAGQFINKWWKLLLVSKIEETTCGLMLRPNLKQLLGSKL